jgi:membrane protease YdiL (CAAX protease family)
MGKALVDEHGALRNGWKVLAYLLGTVAVMMVIGLVLYPLRMAWGRYAMALPDGWLGAVAALMVAKLALRLEDEPFTSLGLRKDRRFLWEFFLGTLGGLGLIALTALFVYALGGFHSMRTPGSGVQNLLQGAWLYLAVAWFEELLFRGYAFQRTVRGLGFTGGQWLFAVCFALSHWANPGMQGATKVWATLNIGLAAVLLAFCWRRTGSLALPIGVHLGWNWTQGSLLGFGVSGTSNQGWWTPIFKDRPEWLTGGVFGLEASLPCALVLGVAILGLWRWKGSAPSADASTALVS